MANRPKTVSEVQAEKAKEKQDTENRLTVANVSKQLIKIHLKQPPGVDFFIGAQDIELKPGQTHAFRKSRLIEKQIMRLQKQGFIRVVSDTDLLPGKEEKRQVVTKR